MKNPLHFIPPTCLKTGRILAIWGIALILLSLAACTSTESLSEPVQYISEEEAKAVALNHAGASQASFTAVIFEYDDARAIFDVEFYVGTTEYDYEIDAISGDIIQIDIDR